jgi:hypothetical protein
MLEWVLGVLPLDYSREGVFLAGAPLTRSLRLLGFLEPAQTALGGIVRDALFLVLTAAGIALNA